MGRRIKAPIPTVPDTPPGYHRMRVSRLLKNTTHQVIAGNGPSLRALCSAFRRSL